MTSIKDKPLKKIVCDTRVKIDSLHNDKINSIENNIISINNLKKELNDLSILKKNNDDINENINLDNRIVFLKNKINNYNNDEYTNYYLDNALLLSDYYNNEQKFSTSNNKNKKNNNKKSVLEFMQISEEDKNNKNNNNYNDIIHQYMVNTNDEYTNNSEISNLNICKICKDKLTIKQNDSELICDKCGYTEKIIYNLDSNTYKDPIRESTYFAYKRINHFNEWLAQFQAKETTDIPKEVYDNINKELKKNKNFSYSNINYNSIREILKKLEYNKYYEHIFHIIYIITGEKAPILNRHTEEKFRSMFKEIQQPFQKHCPKTRSNFLSYSYVLHKFCELLELKELLECFPYLKSNEKLRQQDAIWKNICKELKWEYIPSI